jgi:hypothetical protein
MPEDRPWTSLNSSIGDVLRPVLPTVAEKALQSIAAQLPALGGDLSGEYGRALRSGIERALSRLLDLLGTSEPALDPHLAELYESFGARESRHERPLDMLLAAYRIGARVAWSQFSDAAVRAGMDTRELVVLAESIFVYIDELSAASATGHARDHAARTGYRDALRSRLAEALIAGQAASEPARVQRLADEVAWMMPSLVAVAVLPLPEASEFSGTRLPMAPPDVLVVTMDGEILAVLPDPVGPGRRSRLERMLGPQAEVYVGTVRPPEQAALSLAHARAVHRLVLDGVLPRAPVMVAADHLPELVLHADPGLLADLSSHVLAPLAGLNPRRRDELVRTLRSWLGHQGDRTVVAQELGVHPQTVSYRMAQLAELFGDDLRRPRERFAVMVALEGLEREPR